MEGVTTPLTYVMFDIAESMRHVQRTTAGPSKRPLLEQTGRVIGLILRNACALSEKHIDEAEQDECTGGFANGKGMPPAMDIETFIIARLVKYTQATPEELIMALAIVDRVLMLGEVVLTTRTCHRLYSTALMLALKFSVDHAYANKYYAKIVGISNEELNRLEANLLHLLEFRTWVDELELEVFQAPINTMLASFD